MPNVIALVLFVLAVAVSADPPPNERIPVRARESLAAAIARADALSPADVAALSRNGFRDIFTAPSGRVEGSFLCTGDDQAKETLRARGLTIPAFYDGKTVFTARGPLSAFRDLPTNVRVNVRLGHRLNRRLLKSIEDFMFFGDQQAYSNLPSGDGAIVGIVDSGLDAEHGDFQNGQRFTFYWNQNTGWVSSDPAEIAACGTQCLDDDFHGTHVGSTAAGRFGVARGAEIMAVETDFYTTSILDGINEIFARGAQKNKPVVINLSLGSNYGPMDGTDPFSVGCDEAVTDSSTGELIPGRAIVTSMGNSGGDSVHGLLDFSQGNTQSIDFTIPSYSEAKGKSNDFVYLQFWGAVDAAYSVNVKSPFGEEVGPFTNYQDAAFSGYHLEAGTVTLDGAPSEFPAGLNGDGSARLVEVLLYDGRKSLVPGTWTFTFTQTSSGSSSSTTNKLDAFVSYAGIAAYPGFVGPNADNATSIGSPADSHHAIAVGAMISRVTWNADGCSWCSASAGGYCNLGRQYLYDGTGCDAGSDGGIGEFAYFSSRGPTRDGRRGISVQAPGVGIVAALSRGGESSSYAQDRGSSELSADKHFALQGTSMSAPHVAGAVALILSANPTMTAADVKDLLESTARAPPPTTTDASEFIWGSGMVDLSVIFPSVSCSVDCDAANRLPCVETDVCGACKDGFVDVGGSCVAADCSNSPCPGAGEVCTDIPQRTCSCPVGTAYDANGDCQEVDACATNPCYPGVSCTDEPAPGTGFTCGECPPGYSGDGVLCMIDCSSAPTDCETVQNRERCGENTEPNSCGACLTGFEENGSGECVAAAVTCADGYCGEGEDCTTCPVGCNGRLNGKPANRYCCEGTATGQGVCNSSTWSFCSSNSPC